MKRAMGRIKDYVRFVAWQTGLSYLLMWAVTFWALDYGAAVFGKAPVGLFGAPLAMLLTGLEGIGGPTRVQVSPPQRKPNTQP